MQQKPTKLGYFPSSSPNICLGSMPRWCKGLSLSQEILPLSNNRQVYNLLRGVGAMSEKILEPSQAFVKGNSIPEIFSLGRPGDPEEGLGKFQNFPAAHPSLSQFSCLPLGNSPSCKHWIVFFCFQLFLWTIRAIVFKRPLVTLPCVLIGVVGAIWASNKRGPSVKFNENGSKGYPIQSLLV